MISKKEGGCLASKGTGLGLSQAYNCASAHNGWIEVQSTEAVGTAFQLFFPVPPSSPE